MATTMASNASPAGTGHYSSDLVNMAESSIELTKRFAQLQLKSATYTPKRQPTIVCEDIADDDLLEQSDQQQQQQQVESKSVQNLLLRSASSASLSVPVVCESNEIIEKRRPPLPEPVNIDH